MRANCGGERCGVKCTDEGKLANVRTELTRPRCSTESETRWTPRSAYMGPGPASAIRSRESSVKGDGKGAGARA